MRGTQKILLPTPYFLSSMSASINNKGEKKNMKIAKDKNVKRAIEFIEEKVGYEAAGAFIEIIADSLESLTKGVESRTVRTIEIIYNDCFSTKYDFTSGEYVEEQKL